MRHLLQIVLLISTAASANAQFVAGRSSTPAAQLPTTPALSLVIGGSDDCSSAEGISGQGLFAFDNSAATTGTEGQLEDLCYVFGTSVVANDVWFTWTADASGVAQISTCNQTLVDTKLAAYPGSSCPAEDTSIACNDDACGFQSSLSFSVTSGSTYLLQVGNWSGGAGGTGNLEVAILAEPDGYQYDLGTATNDLGLGAGGDIWWGNLFVAEGSSDTITEVQTSFGAAALPGSIANGSAATIGIWNDPNNDGDLADASLLWSALTTVTNADTDTLNAYPTGGVAVSGNFVVGVVCTHTSGEYPAPLDESFASSGRSFVAYSNTPGAFDLGDLSNNDQSPVDLDAIGFPSVLMTRATGSGPSAPGTAFCLGDGAGTPCPCGNNASNSGGCANGSGNGAVLSGSGSNSVAANDLVLTATSLIPSQPGLYFQGNNAINSGNGNPFGDGLRCAGGGVIRLQVRFSSPTGESSTTASISVNGGVAAGDTKRYQIWYRDPNTSPCNASFNLSSGYEITWSA